MDETPDSIDRPSSLFAVKAVANLAAVGTGVLLHGPSGGAAGALATPAVEQALASTLMAISDRRERRVKRLLVMTAKAADVAPEDLVGRLSEDPIREDLLVRTLKAAQDSALNEKLVALAISLAVGARTESAGELVWETSFVQTLSDLDASHLDLLRAFPRNLDEPGSVSFREQFGELNLIQLRTNLPALSNLIDPTLATLERHGLVRPRSATAAGTYASLSQAATWQLTPFGSAFIDRMTLVGQFLTGN